MLSWFYSFGLSFLHHVSGKSLYRGEAADLLYILLIALRTGWSPWGTSGVPKAVIVLKRVLSCPWNHHLQRTKVSLYAYTLPACHHPIILPCKTTKSGIKKIALNVNTWADLFLSDVLFLFLIFSFFLLTVFRWALVLVMISTVIIFQTKLGKMQEIKTKSSVSLNNHVLIVFMFTKTR